MPKFLRERCKKEETVDKKLRETFARFKAIRNNVGMEHYDAKYMEVYEKDVMCGKHIFRLKAVSGLTVLLPMCMHCGKYCVVRVIFSVLMIIMIVWERKLM